MANPTTTPLKPRRWYRAGWFVGLMMVVFAPVGLFLMWTNNPGWSRKVNWIVTGVVVPIAILIGVGSAMAPAAGPVAAITPTAAPTVAPTAALVVAPTVAATPTPTVVPAAPPTAAPTPPPTAAPTPPPAAPTAKPTPRPTPRPTARPTSAPVNLCGAPPNPWNYNFCSGGTISSPPSNLCNYFNCITSFWKSTNGYVEECNDGMYSHSGGVSGACSYHGGELRPLLGP
jgi:outer membrane biosynthesis protein TonB